MDNFYDKISAFFKGKMSREEARQFIKWSHSGQGEKELSHQVGASWEEETNEEWDPSFLLTQINEVKENQRFLNTRIQEKTYLFKIAISIILIIATSASVWMISRYEFQPDREEKFNTRVVKSNPAGQKSTIYLPDGSKVILNSASKVVYSSDFSLKREVVVEGEAFFEVKKDPNRPFIVYANGLATTALGTSFNICTYNKDKIEVALVSGKVSVEEVKSGSKVLLTPGEVAFHDRKADQLKKTYFDQRTKTLWKDGVIYFDNTPLKDAVMTLERWYGVEIVIENNPEEEPYCTGAFRNDYLSNVLESIAFSLQFEYEINNKRVKIIFKDK